MERIKELMMTIHTKRALWEVAIFVLFGLLGSCFFIQQSSKVQLYCHKKLLDILEKEWRVHIVCSDMYVNFFTMSMESKNCSIVSHQKEDFAWSFAYGRVRFSLLTFLTQNKIILDVHLQDIKAHTQLAKDDCPLIKHIQDIVEDKNLSFSVVPGNVVLEGVDLSLEDAANKNVYALSFDGAIKVTKSTQGAFLCTQILGTRIDIGLNKQQDYLVQLLDLDCRIDYLLEGGDIRAQGSCTLLHKDIVEPFFLKGKLSDDTFSCKLSAQQPGVSGYWKGQLHDKSSFGLHIPIEQLTKSMPSFLEKLCAFEDLQNGDVVLKGSALHKNGTGTLSAEIGVYDKNKSFLAGKITCCSGGKLKGSLRNKRHIPLWSTHSVKTGYHEWYVKKEHCIIDVESKNGVDFRIKARGRLSDHITDQKHDASFVLDLCKDKLHVACSLNKELTAQAHFLLDPFFHCTSLCVKDGSEQLCSLTYEHDAHKTLKGMLSCDLFKHLGSDIFDQYCVGHNALFEATVRQSKNLLTGHLFLKAGNFYLPENRTLIKSLSSLFTLNTDTYMLTLKKAKIGFGKGQITVPYALVAFSPGGGINSLSIPLEIQDVFINWKQHAYGLIYGHALLTKKINQPYHYNGSLVARRALLKEHVFRFKPSPSLWPLHERSDSIESALGVCELITENPLVITTPNFQAMINCDVKAHRNESLEPYFVGMISLEEGSLNLFRNKLVIERGHVQFYTHAMQDPMIDLVAKSRVHKYIITLHLAGSLNNPTIHLESIPSLSEEQIISLLLSGSDQTTLQADLPAMLLYNLSDIILGNKGLKDKTSSFFSRLTRPLRYVQITPDFTNQSGRGGIKGIVSVDVNENFNAQIQKNFNLQEDFAFYLQYLLADDVFIKFIKDQRGDIGSEVEVRLKL